MNDNKIKNRKTLKRTIHKVKLDFSITRLFIRQMTENPKTNAVF